jgi:hypothetical protein
MNVFDNILLRGLALSLRPPYGRLGLRHSGDVGASSCPLRSPMCLMGIHVSGFCHPALVWRDQRTLDDPGGRRPVPAPACAYAGSGRLQR